MFEDIIEIPTVNIRQWSSNCLKSNYTYSRFGSLKANVGTSYIENICPGFGISDRYGGDGCY